MPYVKISELPAATTPLAGTELVEVVQGGASKKVSVGEITADAGPGDVLGPETNSDDYVPQWNGPNSKTLKDGFQITAAGKALLDDADAATQRATLGVDSVGFVVSFEKTEKPPAGAEYDIIPPAGMEFATGLTGWVCYFSANPTAQQVVTFKKNGAAFGTLTVETNGSYAFASASGATINGTSDRITTVFPASQDTTWAGVSITGKGVRA